MAGTAGMNLRTLDALGDVLGLNVVATDNHPPLQMRPRGRPRKGKV
jgi:hypothetical protein